MKKFQLLFFVLSAILFIGTAQTAMAQKRKPNKRTTTTSPRKKPTTTLHNTTSATFVLGDGKLGPLCVNQTVSSLPKKVEGLYDRYKVKVEEFGDMDGTWTETICYFYKGNKTVFKSYLDDKKRILSFVLEKGASFIKTTEGFYVGCSARDVFSKRPMEWTTYYEGTAFARDGHWEFHIPNDGLNAADYPSSLSDIKPTAKISMIVYYRDFPESE